MASLEIQEKGGKNWSCAIVVSPFIIGRAKDNHLCLARNNLSARHCHIIRRGGHFELEDLGSTNGTYLNGKRIAGSVRLKHNDKIALGDFILTMKDSTAPDVPVPESEGDKPVSPKERLRRLYEKWLYEIHNELLQKRELQQLEFITEADDVIRPKVRSLIEKVVAGRDRDIPRVINRQKLVNDVLDVALGLGPLEEFLKDPEITEVMVNNWKTIYIERKGLLYRTDKTFASDRHVVEVIRRIIAPIGRRIDESSPLVDAHLKDGSRVNAIIAPLARSGPSLTIRKFSKDPYTFQDLINFGTFTPEMVQFIKICVEAKRNILISGGTGSGKTTLLGVVSSFIPDEERIVTVEDTAELRLSQPNLVSLEAKPPNIEGKGAIPIRRLVINALRMRPNRIVVGECRGGEAFDMLQAMNTGHDGSLTTIHASSPEESLLRLENMVLLAGMELPVLVIRQQVAQAIHVIVQTSRLSDGTRKVTHITEVLGLDETEIETRHIFVFQQTGFGKDGKVIGEFRATGNIPNFLPELIERGFDIDMNMFI